MDIMIKFNRALKNCKTSVVRLDLDNGEEKIAERSFIFFHDGKRIPLTVKLKNKDNESKVEMILWETDSRVSGRAFDLDKAPSYLPGFNPQNSLFCSELEQMQRKTKAPTLEQKRQVSERYQDYE